MALFSRNRIFSTVLFCLSILMWTLVPGPDGFAQEPTETPASQEAPLPQPTDRFAELMDSVTDTIAAETQSVDNLKTQQADAGTRLKALSLEISQFNIQSSSIGNRIQLPEIPIDALKKIAQAHHEALTRLEEHQKKLLQDTEYFSQQRTQTEGQIAFNQKQLEEIKQADLQGGGKRPILSKIGELLQVLKGKLNLLIDIQESYTQKAQQLSGNINEGFALLQKIDDRIEEVRKKTLFQRQVNPLKVVNGEMVVTEIKQIVSLPLTVGSREFWSSQMQQIWRMGGYLTVTYMILLAAWVTLLIRGHKYFKATLLSGSKEKSRWRTLAAQMVGRDTVLIGLAAVFFLVHRTSALKIWSEFLQFVTLILLVILFSKWLVRYLRHFQHKAAAVPGPEVLGALIFLVKMIRMFVLVFFTVRWVLGSASVASWFIRLLFEIGFLAWSVLFSKKIRKVIAPPETGDRRPWRLAILAAYLISGGGFVMELAGFGSFAVYWFTSWFLSAVIVLWATLSFHLIREWGPSLPKLHPMADPSDGPQDTTHLFRWIGYQVAWLVWGLLLVISLLLVWGEKGAITDGLFRVLTHPVGIGSISLSLMGILNMVVILFITHVAAMLWRQFLGERLLHQSGFEAGLKDSILKLNHYLVWAVGGIIALHAFGLNTATLAVAFGALGVGLGFGLQTIFNNFVSGIILLFERPIQVGDAVEINGIWGSVEKINFRSTVVQTFDNASMIIPNSEFVSSRVVNWTFKDRRLRRKIPIGVAYGSDVELVRKTLLEIAEGTANILKYPAPDVVFYEHGESTLNFWLRYWTHIDHYYQTETDIRFEIERLFRERNIAIAFPQRDVHVYMEKN